jgi:hypothetical protein
MQEQRSLDNGKITENKIASRSYLMPSLSYEFGKVLKSKNKCFTKISLGSKTFYNTGFSAELFYELGYQFKITLKD